MVIERVKCGKGPKFCSPAVLMPCAATTSNEVSRIERYAGATHTFGRDPVQVSSLSSDVERFAAAAAVVSMSGPR